MNILKNDSTEWKSDQKTKQEKIRPTDLYDIVKRGICLVKISDNAVLYNS